MRHHLTLALAAFAVFAASSGHSQQPAPQRAKAYAAAPNIRFDTTPNYLKMPDGLYMGEGIGVATNSKNHVFVYTRSGESSRLFEFDEDGEFVREIGRGLYGFSQAHAVRVDPDDNIWVVDEGTDMVIKFNPEGRVVMLLGRRPESVEGLVETPQRGESWPPPAVPYRFGRPTDVADTKT